MASVVGSRGFAVHRRVGCAQSRPIKSPSPRIAQYAQTAAWRGQPPAFLPFSAERPALRRPPTTGTTPMSQHVFRPCDAETLKLSLGPENSSDRT